LRTLYLLLVVLVAGCAVTLPSGDKFSEAMLAPSDEDEAVLFFYATPDSQKAYYKHILIDGEHLATITNDTFARIVVAPGERSIRVMQHGWKDSVEIPFYVFGGTPRRNPELLAEIEILDHISVEPGSVKFLAIDRKKRPIYYECGETATATRVCSKQVTGGVIEVTAREQALPVLSLRREVCDACE